MPVVYAHTPQDNNIISVWDFGWSRKSCSGDRCARVCEGEELSPGAKRAWLALHLDARDEDYPTQRTICRKMGVGPDYRLSPVSSDVSEPLGNALFCEG